MNTKVCWWKLQVELCQDIFLNEKITAIVDSSSNKTSLGQTCADVISIENDDPWNNYGSLLCTKIKRYVIKKNKFYLRCFVLQTPIGRYSTKRF